MNSSDPWDNEVLAAATWWADLLRHKGAPSRDLVQPEAANTDDMALWTFYAKAPDLDEFHIEMFKESLIPLVAKQCAESEWNPDNPYWGATERLISVDYDPDEILEEAASMAGIKNLGIYLPMKTRMYINPGHVEAKIGYKAKFHTIYPLPTEDVGENK